MLEDPAFSPISVTNGVTLAKSLQHSGPQFPSLGKLGMWSHVISSFTRSGFPSTQNRTGRQRSLGPELSKHDMLKANYLIEQVTDITYILPFHPPKGSALFARIQQEPS